tara:strand:- start:1108 stop:1299 length:192 start_codon:yes stop_codon:yes gene_type:complete
MGDIDLAIWLNTPIYKDYKYINEIIKIENLCLEYIKNNNLKLVITKNSFYMKLIDFVYRNSTH